MSLSERGGYLRYKCRHCGEEYGSLHTPDAWATIVYIVSGNSVNPRITELPMCPEPDETMTYHYCGDGWIGVGDLQGAKLDSQEEDNHDL